MKKYLFFTYGEPGWRGVQIRALRIAGYLKKDEVVFWNLYDSSIIKDAGFDVETKQPGFDDPRAIPFPDGVQTVVFSDIPSNEPFEFSVFAAARLQHKKIVICEQLYKRGQTREDVFREFISAADLFLLNSLSSFHTEETDTVRIVPPQIEFSPSPRIAEEVRAQYGIPEGARILFGAGYNADVLEKIRALHRRLSDGNDIYTIVSAEVEAPEHQGNFIMIPFATGNEYYRLLCACDVALVKFGFLQILEAMALYKPTIVLGEAGAVLSRPDVLDQSIRDALWFTDAIDDLTVEYVGSLLADREVYEKTCMTLRELHNGELHGAREAARLIERLHTVEKRQKPMRLAILINEEAMEKDRLLVHLDSVYPLCIIAAVPAGKSVIKRLPRTVTENPLSSLQTVQPGQILPHSFRDVTVLSPRKYDGLMDILSWFPAWIDHILSLAEQADEIYLTPRARELFLPLLRQEYGHKLRTLDYETIGVGHHANL